ncbi:MAG: YpdA family putative bacillithiol disulfide reductase [Bacilli bacterium]
MQQITCVIIGGGPCGLACAHALMEKNISVVVLEKGNVVDSIYRYPTHQTFFSTSEKLEIADVAFTTAGRKPTRHDALVYYRSVVTRKKIPVQTYTTVTNVTASANGWHVQTSNGDYQAQYVVFATGYYDTPNMMHVPGETLAHVHHYFKEAHPYFNERCVVIGGKNSSVDAALELYHAGAHVTVLYRGTTYSSSVKPWILPEFEALVRTGKIAMHFESHVEEITREAVHFTVGDEKRTIEANWVFAMTGYKPDHRMISALGVDIDQQTGRPTFHPETMETNVSGVYICGVIAAGYNANEIFIENGRFHGDQIARDIASKL